MGPSAMLSVLVNADTALATTKLTKFDKQLAATNDVARKGIEARLGATLDPAGFDAYNARLSRAARVAKDRAAFKAELGANFNNSAFNAYERSIDKANRATGTVETHTNRLRDSFKSLAASAVGFGAAFVSISAAKGAITSTIELARNTERLTAVTGLDAKTASTWIEVTKVRGVSARQTGMAFITLSKQIKAAQDADTKHGKTISALLVKQKAQLATAVASGKSQKQISAIQQAQTAALKALTTQSDKANATFKELGVSQKLIKSGDTEAVLKAVADGLSKIRDPARRAADAQQLFGRGAQALLPILIQGSKGVDEALAAAQRYGAFLPNNVKQLQAAHDAQLQLNYAMDGLKISFTQAVLPVLVSGAQTLLNFIAQMRDGKGAGGDFARAVSSAFTDVKGVVLDVYGVVKTLIDKIGGIKPALELAAGAFVGVKLLKFAGWVSELGGTVKTLAGIPGKLAGLGGGAASRAMPAVGTMEVGTLIAKTMIGGPGERPGAVPGAVPAAASAAEAEAAAAARAASKIRAVVGATAVAGVSGFASAAGAQDTTLNKLNAFARGVDPTSVLHLVGLPALSDLLPAMKKAQTPSPDIVAAFGEGLRPFSGTQLFSGQAQPGRVAAGAAGGPVGSASLSQVATDALKANDALAKLEQRQAGIGVTGAALVTLGRQAAALGDVKYRMADALGAELLKVRSVAAPGVQKIIAEVDKLPPAARGDAAQAMVTMAQQLQNMGVLPQGSAAKVRQAIAAELGKLPGDIAAEAPKIRAAMKTLGSALSTGTTGIAQKVLGAITGSAPKAPAPPPAHVRANIAHAAMVHANVARAHLAADTASLSELQPVLAHAATARLTPQEIAARAAQKAAAATARKRAAAAAKAQRETQAIVNKAAGFQTAGGTGNVVQAPSQAIGIQIQEAVLSNALQAAQNAQNTGAQQGILNKQLKLERGALKLDDAKLAQIQRQLKTAAGAQRAKLSEDELTILQDIGRLQSNIGSAMSSLQSLSGGTSGSGSFDLAPGNVPLPTPYDIFHGLGKRPNESGFSSAGGRVLHHVTNTIHVHVHRAEDVPKVTDAIERATSGHLKAKLRAAGVT